MNQATSKGLTLNIACKNQNHEIVKVLLEYNADPNLKDDQGSNAFDISSKDE